MNQNKLAQAKNFLKVSVILAVAQILVLPSRILADPPAGVPSVEVPTNLNITVMLGKISSYFLGAVIAACVFMILWGALDIATGGDNSEKVTSGKKKILYALIGVVIAAMASVLVSIALSTVVPEGTKTST